MTNRSKSDEPQFTSNPNSVRGNGSRLSGARPRRSFNWDMVPSEQIGKFVKIVTGGGCGIVLGTTSDGGALSITILDGEKRVREWPANLEDFGLLSEWCEKSL